MKTLHDILLPHPRVLFVGINPSIRSASVGHHFAGPGNPFWRLVTAARLVPIEMSHEQDMRLSEFGLALTNLCPRPTRSAAELTRDEIARGKRRLLRKIRGIGPETVVFVGLSIYREFFPKGTAGAGLKDEIISGARVFVLPNPSGLNAAFPGFRHKLIWFEQLREFLDREEVRRSSEKTRSAAPAHVTHSHTHHAAEVRRAKSGR